MLFMGVSRLLGDWSVASGMCRYVCYGCVAAAWEIASHVFSISYNRMQ